MSLLQDIQIAAADNACSLESLLRKCLILAARLKYEDFRNWVQWELDGYPHSIEVPEYRILGCQSFGHFAGAFRQMNNAPIPESCLPPEFREAIKLIKMKQGVGSLESIVKSAKDGAIKYAWPSDANMLFAERIYDGMVLLQGWRMISKDAVVGILSTVRNRVLNFSLEIEASYPDADKAKPNNMVIPEEQVSQIFNTFINGPVGNVAAGHDIHQRSAVSVQQSDFRSLKTFLKSHGVDDGDIKSLKEAIETDPEKPKPGTFGNKVSTWIGNMVKKSASGVWEVGINIASTLLSKAISTYYFGS